MCGFQPLNYFIATNLLAVMVMVYVMVAVAKDTIILALQLFWKCMYNIIIFSSFVEIICETKKKKLLSNIKFTGLVFCYVSHLYMNIHKTHNLLVGVS